MDYQRESPKSLRTRLGVKIRTGPPRINPYGVPVLVVVILTADLLYL